jgi:hypothetical protein
MKSEKPPKFKAAKLEKPKTVKMPPRAKLPGKAK